MGLRRKGRSFILTGLAANRPTLELQNLSHDVSELHKIRRSPDFEALKLRKGRSGTVAAVYYGQIRLGVWWLFFGDTGKIEKLKY